MLCGTAVLGSLVHAAKINPGANMTANTWRKPAWHSDPCCLKLALQIIIKGEKNRKKKKKTSLEF